MGAVGLGSPSGTEQCFPVLPILSRCAHCHYITPSLSLPAVLCCAEQCFAVPLAEHKHHSADSFTAFSRTVWGFTCLCLAFWCCGSCGIWYMTWKHFEFDIQKHSLPALGGTWVELPGGSFRNSLGMCLPYLSFTPGKEATFWVWRAWMLCCQH